jgi:methyl-accepting chemotaxis protein
MLRETRGSVAGIEAIALVSIQNSTFAGSSMDNRRTTIVINKKFQYQYSLLIVALAVLLVNVFIMVRMLFPGEVPLYLPTSMVFGLAALELCLIAAIWYSSLKASHRIAGPVYVIAREVRRLGAGDLSASINLRDKDMFQEEAQAMNESFGALRSRIVTIKGISAQLEVALTAGSDIAPMVKNLASEMARFTSDRKTPKIDAGPT